MRKEQFTPIESWAIRSKLRAFGFLLGLALFISASFTGIAVLLATIANHGLLPLAIASTP
ncbi:MAG TPA: hypothetical protein VHM01_17115 [Alphaproteobacteria bacterium]|nr:hypothetical protein [Alphaproteobacteria bacterium]